MAATKKKPVKKAKAKKRVVKKRSKLKGTVLNGKINGFPAWRVKVSDLLRCAAPYNPRDITEKHLSGLKASTSTFGLVQPIVYNEQTGNIVGGHQRLKTLDPKSETDVLVVDMNLVREKALNLALNNPHIAGRFTSALGDMLDQLSTNAPGVVVDLNLGDLYLDVPTEVMDMLFGDDDDEEELESAASNRPKGGGGSEDDVALETDLSQIILVFDEEDHREAIDVLNEIMTEQGKASYTEAIQWLLDEYES